jgi:hypothetical protein
MPPRYTLTILQGLENPHHGAVRGDIVYSIVFKTSEDNGGNGALYRAKEEQVLRLQAAYDKWDAHGMVWSKASKDVSIYAGISRLQFID